MCICFLWQLQNASKIQHSSLYKVCLFGKPCYFLQNKRHPLPLLLLYIKNNWVAVVWCYLNNKVDLFLSHEVYQQQIIVWNKQVQDIWIWCSNSKNINFIWIKERNTDKKSQTDFCDFLQTSQLSNNSKWLYVCSITNQYIYIYPLPQVHHTSA